MHTAFRICQNLNFTNSVICVECSNVYGDLILQFQSAHQLQLGLTLVKVKMKETSIHEIQIINYKALRPPRFELISIIIVTCL